MVKSGEPGLAEIIQALEGMDEQTRQRTLAAASAYFGTAPNSEVRTGKPSGAAGGGGDAPQIPARVSTWMTQNNLSIDEIESVFHLQNGSAEIIASTIPGKSKKEQSFNCYKLVGASKLLASGASNFDDKEGRELCVSQGCYDGPNHATNFRDKGNDLAGSKEKGWTLTAPGMKSVAALIKDIASNS